MSELPFGPPVRVSPLVKFGRWSFLFLGIAYGAAHQKRLATREVSIREEEEKRKAIRAAKIAEEKKIRNDAEMKMLEELANIRK